jgi:hypothetical protein
MRKPAIFDIICMSGLRECCRPFIIVTFLNFMQQSDVKKATIIQRSKRIQEDYSEHSSFDEIIQGLRSLLFSQANINKQQYFE